MKAPFETSLAGGGKEYSLYPKILWKFEVLRSVRQVRPINITCEIFLNGQSLGRLTKTVTMQSINDCLYYFEDEFGANYPWYTYASYVNENHPQVDRLLKEALDSGIVKQFDGYQSDDPIEVWRQIFAVWSVLQKRGIRYSCIESGPPAMEKYESQHVRFLDESLQATQANCVDGSVLMASILGRIGIEPFLVITPSHMFLGFYLDEDRTTKRFLETTVLNVPPDEEPENLELQRAFGEKYQKRSSWATFLEAANAGRQQYRDHHVNIEDEDEDADFGIVDIRKTRLMGVLPIGFGGK